MDAIFKLLEITMAHDRDSHPHTPTFSRRNERKVLLAFAITVTFRAVEIVGGVISGSLAQFAKRRTPLFGAHSQKNPARGDARLLQHRV